MSTNLACSVVPTMESCPNCKSEMSITPVMPILLVDGFEDITYRCKACRFEVKRTLTDVRARGNSSHSQVSQPFVHEAKKKTATEANQKQRLA